MAESGRPRMIIRPSTLARGQWSDEGTQVYWLRCFHVPDLELHSMCLGILRFQASALAVTRRRRFQVHGDGCEQGRIDDDADGQD